MKFPGSETQPVPALIAIAHPASTLLQQTVQILQ